MKKILFATFLLLFLTGISSAQKLLPIKPSVEIFLKGTLGTPLSNDDFKDHFKSFPGGQLEVIGNITPHFGVYGNFSADFLSPKEKSLIGATYIEDNTYIISGSVGPRYYFNLPGSILYRFFADVGLGIYATRLGDETRTTNITPASATTYTLYHNSYTQIGFNAGAGINIGLGPIGMANLTIKYHSLLKKSEVNVINSITTSNGSVNAGEPQDVPAVSYFSIAVGLGFKLGL